MFFQQTCFLFEHHVAREWGEAVNFYMVHREMIFQSWLLLTPFFNFPIVQCTSKRPKIGAQGVMMCRIVASSPFLSEMTKFEDIWKFQDIWNAKENFSLKLVFAVLSYLLGSMSDNSMVILCELQHLLLTNLNLQFSFLYLSYRFHTSQ